MSPTDSASPAAFIAVVGATGTGKSALSLDLAESLAARDIRAEIVNADAMQLYRGMDIGTAKLPEAERRGIRHHMLDVLDVTDEATVARYQPEARAAVDAVAATGAVPILVGGSGLYVSSVLFDFKFPGTDPVVRERLEAELAAKGPGELFRRLHAADPISSASIGPSNGRRIVRALEVIELTGKPFSAGLPEQPRYWRPVTIIGLSTPRDELVPRLDARVTGMWADGLIAEVQGLLSRGIERGVTASRAIGYAQAIAQIRGDLSEADAIEQTASLTRRYARRQVSWFKRYAHTHWLDYDDPARVEAALNAANYD
ncbi:tRNA (adenosine(37)-N6)-dimethylallyltransferase MiaA [Salinibacterium sp. ZJ454]|uniref:tRNA (adenosine(37)-N6)-dimethylallyltransferase MiaA n=1 Tax=Salinibacterium sp. ZJ454 TaxID=2708339 RepID=UPI00141FB553|nr:tRNA (adenosine(37)-N6)-dimethylallyltransferase MiaA [Salinibacterium sp. ZJ454]